MPIDPLKLSTSFAHAQSDPLETEAHMEKYPARTWNCVFWAHSYQMEVILASIAGTVAGWGWGLYEKDRT
jgi:hypothetical protein